MRSLIIVMAAAIGLGAHMTSAPVRAQQVPGVSSTEITIGAWMPLSGPVAIYGVPLRAGAQAYFNLVNDRGGVNGRKIKWIVEDNAFNPQQTVAIARKLISRDHVLALVVPHGSAQSAAAFPYVLTQERVPFIFPYGGAADWYTPPRPDLFGMLALYEDQAKAVGQLAAADGHKNILVLQHGGASYDYAAENVEPGVKAVAPNAKVERMTVKLGTADYAPIALEIIKKKPDAIVLLVLQQDLVSLARELKQQGAAIPLYTYAVNTIESVIDLGGPYVEGMKATSLTVSPLADTSAVEEYRAALKKYFPDQKPDFTSLWTFGMAKTFVEALSRINGPVTRTTLTASIENLKDYDSGIFPSVSFAADRHLGATETQPMQIKNGKWEPSGHQMPIKHN